MTRYPTVTVTVTVTVALLVASCVSARAQDPEATIATLRREIAVLSERLAEERARLLVDLRVNGVKLDPMAIKREAIYLAGNEFVEAKLAEFFTLDEMRRQIDSGRRRPEEFLVRDEDFATALASRQAEFAARNPGVDFWQGMRLRRGLDEEAFRARLRQSILFDRVFLPGSPRNWPDITKEAIKAQTQSHQGPKFLEQLEKATAGVDAEGNPKKLPEFWVNMMRQFVQRGLRKSSDIRRASHGLPPDVVLHVNGFEWGTDDAFRRVGRNLTLGDIERAVQEVAVRETLRQELVANGVYLSDEAFRTRYAAYRPPSLPWPINLEVLRSPFAGYPCMEVVRARWRLLASYIDLIRDEIHDANLQAHADRYAALFAGGRCDIDVIPFQARDLRTGVGRPDGMAEAKARADAVFASLAAGEIDFDEALLQCGEFFDGDETRGRCGSVALDELQRRLGDSDYSRLLDGFSISRCLFFAAEVGKIHGPIAGPDAWFLARVNARQPARRRVVIERAGLERVDRVAEYERELVREDYVRQRFFEWADRILGRATSR